MNCHKNINIKDLYDDSFIDRFIKESIKIKGNDDAIDPIKTIIVTGPTAIGKSGFALKLAQKLDGVIINADSLQVYKDLAIISARPSEDEERFVPHKLYGFMDYHETCSVALWLEMAKREILAAHEKGKVAIIVGGTGMYIRTLYQGIASIPDIPDEIVNKSKILLEQIGNKEFYEQLCSLDPNVKDKLNPNDTQRILRAFNVVTHTGRSIFDFHESAVGEHSDVTSLPKKMIVMLPNNKAELLDRAAQRFKKMLEQGAIDEVRALHEKIDAAKAIEPSPTILKAIGFKEINDYLCKKISKEEAEKLANIATNQYIKRQITWMRNQFVLNDCIGTITFGVNF